MTFYSVLCTAQLSSCDRSFRVVRLSMLSHCSFSVRMAQSSADLVSPQRFPDRAGSNHE